MSGLLSKVLKTNDIYIWNKSSSLENFSLNMVKNYINKGLPIVLDLQLVYNPVTVDHPTGLPGHFVVIYGYSKNRIYIANINNDGTAGMCTYNEEVDFFKICLERKTDDRDILWRCNQNIEYYVNYAFVPNPQKGNVLMSNPLVFYDSDGDGVMNFDEIYRFNTDPFNPDTDNDGLRDKEDILACVNNLYNYSKPITSSRVSYSQMEKYEDQGYFTCANNPDFDGDGIIDGLEDLNGDGFFEDNGISDDNSGFRVGELNIGKKDDRSKLSISDDIPEDYTIFTFSEMKINDRARCYSGIDTLKSNWEKFCNVFSWATQLPSVGGREYKFENGYADGTASVSLGVESAIGSLDAWGRIFIRNRAHLYGHLILRTNGIVKEVTLEQLKKEKYLDYQEIPYVDGMIKLSSFKNRSYYAYLDEFKEDSQNRTIRVEPGKSYDLRDGDAYSELIVENGATLKIHSGEMFVERNLQLEPEAKVVFDNLDGSTVLHIAGDVLWKTKANTPTTDMAYWSQVASRFKLVSHTSKPIFIDGQWGGTIYNPLGTIVIGQSERLIYGRFLAKKYEQHQFSKLFRVDFIKNPNPPLAVGLK